MGLFGRKFKSSHKSEPMKLSDLPTWFEAGPKSEIPACKPKYEVNSEINKKISFWMGGDSTNLECDAIVNAANSHLMAGGGICGAIFSAAGPGLQEACNEQGYTETGSAKMTPGFKLPAKYIIHAVGPIGENKEKLESAYNSTLGFMDNDKVKSIGFCCISTGIYGYPIENATHVALETVRKWLEVPENLNKTDRLIFVVFMKRDQEVYYQLAHEYFPIEGVSYEAKPEAKSEKEDNKEEKPEFDDKHEEDKKEKKQEKAKEEVKEEEKKEKKEEKAKEEVKEEEKAKKE